MANNNNLFNAVVAGAGGGTQQRWITDDAAGDYAAQQALITTLAAEIDAAIPRIPGDANIAQTALMQNLVSAVFADRYIQNANEASYAPIIASIVALYTSLNAGLLAPTQGRTIPSYNVYDFGAVGDGIADDTAALNAAIAAANAVPGDIYLASRHRITAPLTTVTGNNVSIIGQGEFNGGSRIIVDSVGAIDVFTFSGQYQVLSQVWIVGIRVYTAGWGIVVSGAFRFRADRVVMSEICFGARVFKSVLTRFELCNITNNWGVFGFFAEGDAGGDNHSVVLESCMAGTSFPAAIVGNPTGWVAATAYIVGNVVIANGGLYQCTVAGNSAGAGTGPSGIPSTNPATAHTTPIVDGTVSWVFAMPAAAWYVQSSFADTFELINCGALQGRYGFSSEDPANTGTSFPQFARASNFQVDHPLERGVRLAAGGSSRFVNTFVTSVLDGVGIEIGTGYSGNWEFLGGEVFGCDREGVFIGKGDGILNGLQIGGIGGATPNTRDCILLQAGIVDFSIVNCSAGRMFNASVPTSRYGINIPAGCDRFIIANNRLIDNMTGPINNLSGNGSANKVISGNIPAYQATISVVVPALAAGVTGYVDVSTVGTTMAGIQPGDIVSVNPTADLAAAGAGNGYMIGNPRVTAINSVRLEFVGTLAGGASNFNFKKVA